MSLDQHHQQEGHHKKFVQNTGVPRNLNERLKATVYISLAIARGCAYAYFQFEVWRYYHNRQRDLGPGDFYFSNHGSLSKVLYHPPSLPIEVKHR